jgi:endonuclease G, mitochondrial
VITGPVLRGEDLEQIGLNRVSVPEYFYKIVAVPGREKERTIAFLLPNDISTLHLREYIVTVDSIEERTGIDFFPDLFDLETEAEIESSLPTVKWPFNESRYRTRIEIWNNR